MSQSFYSSIEFSICQTELREDDEYGIKSSLRFMIDHVGDLESSHDARLRMVDHLGRNVSAMDVHSCVDNATGTPVPQPTSSTREPGFRSAIAFSRQARLKGLLRYAFSYPMFNSSHMSFSSAAIVAFLEYNLVVGVRQSDEDETAKVSESPTLNNGMLI